MGAATNYGKSSDLGINSPTHRNTHNENLFGSSENVSAKSKTDIEDIFNNSNDDFNPRAEEFQQPPPVGDFGDFESAFGNTSQTKNNITTLTSTVKATQGVEFADFSSAFTTCAPLSPALSSSSSLSKPAKTVVDTDNFLFDAQPLTVTTSSSAASNNNLLSADLFGNSVITNAFASPTTGNKDLLSDFGDLTLHSAPQGEHV